MPCFFKMWTFHFRTNHFQIIEPLESVFSVIVFWCYLRSGPALWSYLFAFLQAQISFLQGERRGQENLKKDLVRRIKMLEYSLRQERWQKDRQTHARMHTHTKTHTWPSVLQRSKFSEGSPGICYSPALLSCFLYEGACNTCDFYPPLSFLLCVCCDQSSLTADVVLTSVRVFSGSKLLHQLKLVLWFCFTRRINLMVIKCITNKWWGTRVMVVMVIIPDSFIHIKSFTDHIF